MPRERDGFARLRQKFAERPELGLGIAVGLGIWALQTALRKPETEAEKAERRARHRESSRRKEAERAEMMRKHRLSQQRSRLLNEYFGSGPGRALLEQKGRVRIPRGRPFPDAVFERLPGGFRYTKWRIISEAESLTLSAGYDSADRGGGLSLSRDGQRIWGIGLYATGSKLAQYQGSDELDVDSAKLAARLLSAPNCQFEEIDLIRPDYQDIRRQLWIDYMHANPALAAELEWSEDRPLS